MHINSVQIRNFRNFRNAELRFKKGVNTLIGENGSGKTNAFQAIRLLLDDTLSRRSAFLRELDFNRSIGSWRGHWIIIKIEFAELDASEMCQMLKHRTGSMDGNDCGTYTFYFRPNPSTRKELYEASQRSKQEAVDLVDSIQIDQYEPMFTGHGHADFTNDEVYKAVVGTPSAGEFPNPENDDLFALGTRLSNPLHTEVSCTFIKALRDVVSELKNYRDSPLLNLLRGSEASISIADANSICDAVGSLNDKIGALSEIRDLANNIQSTLHETAGYAYAPSVDVRAALPDDLQRLMQSLVLRVADPLDAGYSGELNEISLGGANLIYITLKLLEYELKLSSDRVAHFLLIEEPESHIHTHIQKTLFSKYDEERTQVIVSTHSTHVSAASRIRSVNILAKAQQRAVVFHPSNNLDPTLCVRVERYLDAVRSTLLFAKGVLLVEGDAELILIPSLVSKVLGISLDEIGVSLISMSSAVFGNVATVFHPDRVNRNCAILSDLDRSHIALPTNPAHDTPAQKDARNSQASGESRKCLLEELCHGNPFLGSFLGEHTFEVELLKSGNSQLFCSVLPDIYDQQARIAESQSKLTNTDLEIAGSEVLRLAKKEGKGWFALQLTTYVTNTTSIPEYILKGLAFACKNMLSEQTVNQVLKHRLRVRQDSGSDLGSFASFLISESQSTSVLVGQREQFTKAFPDDPLSLFAGAVWDT